MRPTAAISRLDLGINFSEIDLVMNRQGFIAHRVLPLIGREKPTGAYPTLSLEQLLQLKATGRAPGGGYHRSTGLFSTDTYSTTEKGHEAVLDERTLSMYDDLVDAEMWEAERIKNIVLTDYEKEVADYLFNATTFSGKTAGVSTEWSTVASAAPVSDIETRRETIIAASGQNPNALIVNDQVFRNLTRCSQIIDTLRYQGFQDARASQISAQALAISLNLDMVIVAGMEGAGVYNSANPSDAASISRIWSSEYALLAKVGVTNNPSEPCLGRTIVWDAESAVEGDRLGVITESYEEEQSRSTILRARSDWGKKILYLDCAYLLSNITA